MFSIIIPTYNSGKNLVKTLASIYKNDFKDFEIIVVDDGSNDNTRELIRNYSVIYVFLERNRGAAFARNKGAELAKGDILLFIDADVEVKENLLRNVDEQFKASDYDVISGVFAKEPKIKNIFLLFQSTLSNYNFSKTDFSFSTHLSAIRKKAFNELKGFDERFKSAVAEDFDFSQRLIINGYKCKTDMEMDVYHHQNFTFYSLLRRTFRFGLLLTPLILEYSKNPEIRSQKKRYLVNSEYTFSYILILLLLPAIIVTFYSKLSIIFLIWLASYILVKSNYLFSVKRKHLLMLLLSLANDIVALTGCLIGTCRYYYDKRFKKNYN